MTDLLTQCEICTETIDHRLLPKIELEGWIWFKAKGAALGWKRRYCVLYGKHLSTFEYESATVSVRMRGEWTRSGGTEEAGRGG
jgi:hypothetical protein